MDDSETAGTANAMDAGGTIIEKDSDDGAAAAAVELGGSGTGTVVNEPRPAKEVDDADVVLPAVDIGAR
jgi:hypothetical protein